MKLSHQDLLRSGRHHQSFGRIPESLFQAPDLARANQLQHLFFDVVQRDEESLVTFCVWCFKLTNLTCDVSSQSKSKELAMLQFGAVFFHLLSHNLPWDPTPKLKSFQVRFRTALQLNTAITSPKQHWKTLYACSSAPTQSYTMTICCNINIQLWLH